MLDTFSKFLLDYIKEKSKDGFIVLEIDEIISSYKGPTLLDENEVLFSIEKLNNIGYISLKYNDGKLFCVCITDKGKNYGEDYWCFEKNNESKYYKIVGWCAFFSFVGGFLGCLAFSLIDFLIN